jgi:hypothetical protein
VAATASPDSVVGFRTVIPLVVLGSAAVVVPVWASSVAAAEMVRRKREAVGFGRLMEETSLAYGTSGAIPRRGIVREMHAGCSQLCESMIHAFDRKNGSRSSM